MPGLFLPYDWCMKKIIGVALFFLVAAAPALAGGNGGGSSNSGGNGGFRMSGGTTRSSGSLGSGMPNSFAPAPPMRIAPAPPTRIAPPARLAPPTREAPMQSSLDPQRKLKPVEWTPSERYYSVNSLCQKSPYQRPEVGLNGCGVNPGVLFAFPDSGFGDDF